MDNEKKQVTYNSSITGETQVTFDIQQYMNNRAMFIGLMCNEDGYEEPFGDVTVNLSVAAPNYCGYLNVNDIFLSSTSGNPCKEGSVAGVIGDRNQGQRICGS